MEPLNQTSRPWPTERNSPETMQKCFDWVIKWRATDMNFMNNCNLLMSRDFTLTWGGVVHGLKSESAPLFRRHRQCNFSYCSWRYFRQRSYKGQFKAAKTSKETKTWHQKKNWWFRETWPKRNGHWTLSKICQRGHGCPGSARRHEWRLPGHG